MQDVYQRQFQERYPLRVGACKLSMASPNLTIGCTVDNPSLHIERVLQRIIRVGILGKVN